MDLVFGIIVAIIIGATSVITAVGVGIGCLSCGAIYRYNTRGTEGERLQLEQVREDLSSRIKNNLRDCNNHLDKTSESYRGLVTQINKSEEMIKKYKGINN